MIRNVSKIYYSTQISFKKSHQELKQFYFTEFANRYNIKLSYITELIVKKLLQNLLYKWERYVLWTFHVRTFMKDKRELDSIKLAFTVE